jgi:hypothetical protein
LEKRFSDRRRLARRHLATPFPFFKRLLLTHLGTKAMAL